MLAKMIKQGTNNPAASVTMDLETFEEHNTGTRRTGALRKNWLNETLKDAWTEIQKKDTTLANVEFDKTRNTHRNLIREFANSEIFKFNRTKNNENHDNRDSDNDNDSEYGQENHHDNDYENAHEFESQLMEMTDGSPPHQNHTVQTRANPTTATNDAPTNWVQGSNLQVNQN